MNESVINYTSTGFKLLWHLDRLKEIQATRLGRPVQAHLMPTSKCNLKCVFCSNVNRKTEELSMDLIQETIDKLISRGLKSVEITGGGDPTVYPQINELIAWLLDRKLNIGFITNGLDLAKNVDRSLIEKFVWLRISMNTLDYHPDWQPPDIPGHVAYGFSYVWNEKSTIELIEKAMHWAKLKKVRYLRVVPDCCKDPQAVIKTNEFLRPLVKRLGPPAFLQDKLHQAPQKCYIGYIKPCLYCDGYLYPCSSVVLNPDSDRIFADRYRLCKLEEIGEFFDKPMKDLGSSSCTGCVFTLQNTFLDALINEPEHKDFP